MLLTSRWRSEWTTRSTDKPTQVAYISSTIHRRPIQILLVSARKSHPLEYDRVILLGLYLDAPQRQIRYEHVHLFARAQGADKLIMGQRPSINRIDELTDFG